MPVTLYLNGHFDDEAAEGVFVEAALDLANTFAANIAEGRLDTQWHAAPAIPTPVPDASALDQPPVNATPDEMRAWLVAYDERQAATAANEPPPGLTVPELRDWLAKHDERAAAAAERVPVAGVSDQGPAPAPDAGGFHLPPPIPTQATPPAGMNAEETRAWLAAHTPAAGN